MRIRSVHPEQWTDDQFLTCSPLARLLALALRNEADDNGIFEWNAAKIKVRLLPADNCDVSALLDELKASDQVMRFDSHGRAYGIIRNFQRFQSPRKPSYKHPTPEMHLPQGYEMRKEYRTNAEPVPYQSGTEGEKEKEKEKETTSTAKSFAGASSPPSPHGEEDTEGDPVADFPILGEFYPRLLAMIRVAHPAAPLPKGDTKGRDVLAKLARLDGFPESEIVAALEWLFTAEHKDAEFWRTTVAAVAPLRKVCDSGLSKFASIHEAWKRAGGRGAPDVPDWVDEDHHYCPGMTDAEVMAMERELAEEQAAGATR